MDCNSGKIGQIFQILFVYFEESTKMVIVCSSLEKTLNIFLLVLQCIRTTSF